MNMGTGEHVFIFISQEPQVQVSFYHHFSSSIH